MNRSSGPPVGIWHWEMERVITRGNTNLDQRQGEWDEEVRYKLVHLGKMAP